MCVAFFTLDHPDYALILCSNRDEALSRPTEPAHFHAFGQQRAPDVLSGIDVQGGGTWLGLHRTGKLALLTNITEPHDAYPLSRGHLLSAFLSSPSTGSLEDDVRAIAPRDARYAGFNLLLLAPAPSRASSALAFEALLVTNHGGGGPISYRPLTDAERHLSGLSNGIDGHDGHAWPKIRHGTGAFETLLETLSPDTSDDELAERLLDLLTWRSCPPPRERAELRETIEVAPFRLAGDDYGTRLSTVVLVKRSGQVSFIERDRWVRTQPGPPMRADPCARRVFRFDMDGRALSK